MIKMEVLPAAEAGPSLAFTLSDAYAVLQQTEKFKTRIHDYMLAYLADLVEAEKLDFMFYLNTRSEYAKFSELNSIIAGRDLPNLAVTAILAPGKRHLDLKNALERLVYKYIGRQAKCVDAIFTSYQVEALENAAVQEHAKSLEKVQKDAAYTQVFRLASKCATARELRGVLADFGRIQPELVAKQMAKLSIILGYHRDCDLFERAFKQFYQNPQTMLQPFGLQGSDLGICLLLRRVGIESSIGEFQILE